ncbi:uncharacterized protein H6S33_001540 [Morchella sextelata]|uniref:uncharacterized protein n=1 Tax=Morchella sextelata TaxID=1174677 RepID=UPI001D04B8FF|nr:uncharacterized protein H6S33_001540 [Morchella sextelata]KAH0608406.1 hypothetical protein H6S33_001540 [Morchella sextelata]
MATSFLPFCAHCEQQIIVPNTGILYCSEKCRRKDQAKPPPIPIGPSSPSTCNWSTPPLTPYGDEFSNGPPRKNYVEPLSPTPPRSVPDVEPLYPEYAGSPPISITGRTTSSDGGYSNYHYNHHRSGTTSPIDSQPSSPTNNNANLYNPPRRPVHLRSLTGGSISSFSGNASNNPPTQYQLHQQRPLPPLHHPVSYSSSPRSIDLVTPYLLQDHSQRHGSSSSLSSGSSSGSSSSEDLQYGYEKTLPIAEVAAQVGNLKTLFNFDAIRGRPTASRNGMYTPMDRTPERSPVRGVGRQQPLMMRSSGGGWPN